jgi:hypothetical protein
MVPPTLPRFLKANQNLARGSDLADLYREIKALKKCSISVSVLAYTG